MNDYIATIGGWASNQLILTAILFALYSALRYFNPNAGDRFLFLKLAFCGVLFVPWIPRLDKLLPSSDSMFPPSALSIERVLIQNPVLMPRQEAWWDFVPHAMIAIYLIVTLVLLTRVARSLFKVNSFTRKHKVSFHYRNIPVRIADVAMPPATFGLFKPSIVIPKQIYFDLSTDDLALILKHEFVHIERRDYAFHLIKSLVKALLFFSPFIHKMAHSFDEDMELSCDSLVLAQGEHKARNYAGLLVKLSELQLGMKKNFIYSGLFVSNSFISRRVVAMKKPRIKSRLTLTLAAFVLFTLGIAPAVVSLGVENSVEALIKSPRVGLSEDLYYYVLEGQDTENPPFSKSGTLDFSKDSQKEIGLLNLRVRIQLIKTSKEERRFEIAASFREDQAYSKQQTILVGADKGFSTIGGSSISSHDGVSINKIILEQFKLTLHPKDSTEVDGYRKFRIDADGKVSLSFSEPSEMKDVVRVMAELSSKKVILNRDINFGEKITISSTPALDKHVALQTVITALHQAGYTTEDRGEVIHIARQASDQ